MEDQPRLRAGGTAASIAAAADKNRSHIPVNLRRCCFAAAWAATVLLTACGGGGGGGAGGGSLSATTVPPPAPTAGPASPAPATAVAVAVTVVDGALSNALVCLDKNDNDTCDATEPSARTDSAGRATLAVDPADAGRFPVLAMVGTDAIDADYGRVPTAYAMKAPADRTALVTPLTTMVQAVIETAGLGTDQAEAAARASFGFKTSLFHDYSGRATAEDVKLFALARMAVLTTQNMTAALQGAVGTAAIDGLPVTPADIQRLVRGRILDILSAVYAPVGDATVLPALASGDPKQIDAVLASKVTGVVNMAGIGVAGVPTRVGVARAMKSGTPASLAPGGWFDSVSVNTTQTWSAHYSTATAATVPGGATTFVDHRLSSNQGVLKALGTSTPGFMLWTGAAWSLCPLNTTQQRSAPDANGRSVATYCNGAWTLSSTRIEVDVAGRPMQEISTASSLGGFYAFYADALLIGSTVFPSGSKIAYERQVWSDGSMGYDTRRGNVLPVAPAALAAGDAAACAAVSSSTAGLAWGAEAMTLDALTARNPGMPCVLPPDSFNGYPSGARNEWWDATTVPLAKLGTATLTGAGYYSANHLLRASFGANGAVTYYRCQERMVDGSARNCDAIGTGTATIDALGDARVMDFDGLPYERILADQPGGFAQPLLVERGGKVFSGRRGRAGFWSQGWLNTPAADAVLALVGVAPIDPSLPVAPTIASYAGDWLFWDAAADYVTGPSTTLSITSKVRLSATPSGFSCVSNSAGVPGSAVSCTLSMDPATGAATVTLPTGTAQLTLDLETGAVAGTWTPTSGSPTALAGGRR